MNSLKPKPQLGPAGLRAFAAQFEPYHYDTIRSYADAWERDRADLLAASGRQISGFYAEQTPTFRQGEPEHELEELVTAEDCTSMVTKIEELNKQIQQLKESR